MISIARRPPLKKTGKSYFKIVSFFTLIWLLASTAMAASDVTATVDENKISLGEAITLTISVETSDSVNVGTPRLPSLDGFNIINRNESIESRSTFVNGQFQYVQKKNFHFVLSPTRQGKLTIGSAEVVVGNSALKTKPIVIDVGPPGAAGAQKRQAQRPRQQQQDPLEEDPFFQDADDLFSQLLQRRGALPHPGGIKTQPINENEAFFIQLEVDKNSVYEGEQVTANYYLVTPYSIRDIDTLKYPSLKGFWKEDIEIATRLNFQREIINGVAYSKALLASYALFPLKPGKSTIDPYKAKCTVMTQQNMLGMGTPYSYTKASQPVTIDAKPLPKDKQPQDFSGAVGSFKISSKLEAPNGRVPVNQPFSLKIKIEGRGNAKVIELPPLQLPPDLETYDTKVDSKFFRDGTSYKEFELFLIPRKQGKFTIPAITISSFDTERGQYIQSQTNTFDIQVGEGKAGESYQTSPLSMGDKNNIQQRRDKELPPPMLEYAAAHNIDSKVWVVLWVFVFLSIVAALFFKLRSELGIGQKKRGLRERIQKRLRELAKTVEQNDYRKIGAEGINCINVVLGELSKDGAADASFEKLIQKTPPSVRRELEHDLSSLVSFFHGLAFAPTSMAEQMSTQAKEKFRQLDRVLMKAIDIGHDEKESK